MLGLATNSTGTGTGLVGRIARQTTDVGVPLETHRRLWRCRTSLIVPPFIDQRL